MRELFLEDLAMLEELLYFDTVSIKFKERIIEILKRWEYVYDAVDIYEE